MNNKLSIFTRKLKDETSDYIDGGAIGKAKKIAVDTWIEENIEKEEEKKVEKAPRVQATSFIYEDVERPTYYWTIDGIKTIELYDYEEV